MSASDAPSCSFWKSVGSRIGDCCCVSFLVSRIRKTRRTTPRSGKAAVDGGLLGTYDSQQREGYGPWRQDQDKFVWLAEGLNPIDPCGFLPSAWPGHWEVWAPTSDLRSLCRKAELV